MVGTGYVGLPAAIMWAKAGYQTIGVDINENLVAAINDRTLLVDEQELNDLLADESVKEHLRASTTPCEADVYVVAVPTPVDPIRKVADLDAVKSAVESICPFLRSGSLVIIESTIPPLATRDVVAPIIRQLTGLEVPGDVLLAHCPERILPGDIFKEIVYNDRLIGGMDERSSQQAASIYRAFVKGELHATSDLVAELSKLMENTYRDVNIALANELATICASLGVDSREVFGFANKHPRVNILSPGIGVGGHCIPVDPWFLKEAAPYDSQLITTARLINDSMPDRTAARVRREVADVTDPLIVALGASYKRNSRDERESPARQVVDILARDGYRIVHKDPLLDHMSYASLPDIAEGADLLLVLVGHEKILADLANDREVLQKIMRHHRTLIMDQV